MDDATVISQFISPKVSEFKSDKLKIDKNLF